MPFRASKPSVSGTFAFNNRQNVRFAFNCTARFSIMNFLAHRSLLPLTLSALALVCPGLARRVHAAPTSMNSTAISAPTVSAALATAGANRAQIARALAQVPASQREGMEFLVANMPAPDLQTLSADFLLNHVAQVYRAFNATPWNRSVPREIFLNDVLPYASLNEKRENASALLLDKIKPIVAGAQTPGEAALRLNKQLFPAVNVKYSTARQRPDQCVSMSLKSGLASCSGLSILLVNACRAAGVPARVVGTPMWSNERGNHTWVEVWDKGDWHFIGAAEPDDQGYDHGWFAGDAAAAKDDGLHAIYATSWKRNGTHFPLVWDNDLNWVSAQNVTARYARDAKPQPSLTRLQIGVIGANNKRVAAKIKLINKADATQTFEGTTIDESGDTNNFLTFNAPRAATYALTIEAGGKVYQSEIAPRDQTEQLVSLQLTALDAATPAVQPAATREMQFTLPRYVSPPVTTKLSDKLEAQIEKSAADYFAAAPQQRAGFKFPKAVEKALQNNEPAVRAAVWKAYVATRSAALKTDFDKNQVTSGEYLSPYTIKTVGTRPPGGWPLFIAMHGGGGTAKEVNDSQWRGMATHYKDHPEVGGYKYIALRAPNDTWNGFYDDYVYPLINNLIEQQVVLNDVDSDKVFIMGYSHGAYGAYAIGPKMPDRFAAIHASAGAATDGETTPVTLRNTPFTAWVGERDLAYDRLSRNQKFADEIVKLRGERTDIYPVTVTVKMGFEHGNLKDGDLIPEMYPNARNPVPRTLNWLQTDGVIRDFYWLHADNPAKTQRIDATIENNTVDVAASPDVKNASVSLDSRLIDFSKPVTFNVNGQTFSKKLTPSFATLCETMMQRADPELAFSARVALPLNQ